MWSYFRSWKAGSLDIPGFIHAAKAAGADGVELLDFFYGDAPIEPQRQAALAALEAAELPCPIFSVAQNFAKPLAEDRANELAKIVFGMEEAAVFGAGVVRVFAGDVAPGISFDQAREWIVEGLAEASKLAADRGLLLALENHGTLAGRGEQVLDLITDVRSLSGVDALGANPDTGNFFLIDPPSENAVARVAHLASMGHFKDFRFASNDSEGFAYGFEGKRFVGTALGEGEVNLGACVQELNDAGFDGWLSLEYEGEEDPMTAVPRSLAAGRAIIDAVYG